MKTLKYIALGLLFIGLLALSYYIGTRVPDRMMTEKLAESHRIIEKKDSVILLSLSENSRIDSMLTEFVISFDNFRSEQDSLMKDLAKLNRRSRDRILGRLSEIEPLSKKRNQLQEEAQKFGL